MLEPNNLLANPEKLLEGKLHGPEHLMERDGAIFTSLHNGDVVKIVGEKITVLGKFGKLCCELGEVLKGKTAFWEHFGTVFQFSFR